MPTLECPTCRRSFTVPRLDEAKYRPFCCERCRLVDLGRWLDGTYAVGEPMPEFSESTPTVPDSAGEPTPDGGAEETVN